MYRSMMIADFLSFLFWRAPRPDSAGKLSCRNVITIVRPLITSIPQKSQSTTHVRWSDSLVIPGIIRNRLKIASAIQNASAFMAIQQEFGSFDDYLWRFVDNQPLRRKRGHQFPRVQHYLTG